MIRLVTIVAVLTVQLIITSCTGYGLVYDDKRPETSEDEQYCLKQPDTKCLLEFATTITKAMTEKVAHAEALSVLAKTHFELGNHQAALKNITEMRVMVMQFSTLFELTHSARKQGTATENLLALAESITQDIEQPANKLAALLLSSILLFENQKPQSAQRYINQAINFAKVASKEQTISIDSGFFKKILPKLLLFDTTEAINELITLQTVPSQQILARVEYTVLLKDINQIQAELQKQQILTKWHKLEKKQHELAQASIIKLLVNFNNLTMARDIKQQQSGIISKVTLSAVIIQQLVADTKISGAKLELVQLLQDIRLHPKPEISPDELPAIRQQAAQNEFLLDNLRAQSIADVALALAEANKMSEAVHFAEQIQLRMGHIQGYTLTKLAKIYAIRGDINTALLTMESIHRPVNRAASLAQISAEVAKKGDLNRAIIIASRINRQSWRDIAFSEISIAQAKQKDINAAMKTLNSIQRSYSTVYAMTEIARTLQASQNKR